MMVMTVMMSSASAGAFLITVVVMFVALALLIIVVVMSVALTLLIIVVVMSVALALLIIVVVMVVLMLLIIMVVMSVALTLLIVVVVMVVLMLLITVVVMMVVLMLELLKVGCQGIDTLDSIKNILTVEHIPRSSYYNGTRVELAEHSDGLLSLTVLRVIGMREDNCLRLLDLIAIELTEVLNIHLTLVDICHCGI